MLEVLAIVGSTEHHAREVALAAYLLGFLDICIIHGGNVFELHSLRNKLCCHQSWFATVRTSVRLNYTNQGLEVLHILCVGHLVVLIVRRHSMLCLFKDIHFLLVVAKAAAVPLYD